MTITKEAAAKRQRDRVGVCIAQSLDAQEKGNSLADLIRILKEHAAGWKDFPGESAAWDAVLGCLQEELRQLDLSARRWATRADELIMAGPGGGEA